MLSLSLRPSYLLGSLINPPKADFPPELPYSLEQDSGLFLDEREPLRVLVLQVEFDPFYHPLDRGYQVFSCSLFFLYTTPPLQSLEEAPAPRTAQWSDNPTY